jgi:hypothetical protein
MNDLDIGIKFLKVFSQKPAVAFFGRMFAAQQAAAVQRFRIDAFFDISGIEQI